MANLMCVRCLVAFQANELTGAYDEPVEKVTDRPLAASVVYNGLSLCDRHFNTERGHAADFLHYPITARIGSSEQGPDSTDQGQL